MRTPKKAAAGLLLSLAVLFVLGCGKNSTGSEDGGTKDLALLRIDEVVQAAEELPDDVVLVWVSAEEVGLDGKSSVWVYVYYSPGEDTYYQYEASENGVTATEVTVDPAELSGEALPDTIIDSDIAIQLAEANGGSAFRNTYAHTTMQLNLLMVDTTGFGSGGAKAVSQGRMVDLLPVWEAWYIAPDAEAVALVNGRSGEFIQFLLLFTREAVTAKQGYSAAQKKYGEVAAGTLIWVGTSSASVGGNNLDWEFIYKYGSTLRSIRWEGGMLEAPANCSNPEANMSFPALPSGWLDSDQIMSIAESNGGTSYRAAHPSVTIEMYLFPAGKGAAHHPVAVWEVFYGITPENGWGIAINAVSGAVMQ